MTGAGWALLATLPAQSPPNNQGPEFGGSSPIGLVVTLVMAVALIFLIRSMNKHLRKVPASFDPPEDPGGESDGPPATGGATTTLTTTATTTATTTGEAAATGDAAGPATGREAPPPAGEGRSQPAR